MTFHRGRRARMWRALRRPGSDRRWTIDPPQGRRPEITADEVLDAWGYPT